jgi:hypothetical protein
VRKLTQIWKLGYVFSLEQLLSTPDHPPLILFMPQISLV